MSSRAINHNPEVIYSSRKKLFASLPDKNLQVNIYSYTVIKQPNQYKLDQSCKPRIALKKHSVICLPISKF